MTRHALVVAERIPKPQNLTTRLNAYIAPNGLTIPYPSLLTFATTVVLFYAKESDILAKIFFSSCAVSPQQCSADAFC